MLAVLILGSAPVALASGRLGLIAGLNTSKIALDPEPQFDTLGLESRQGAFFGTFFTQALGEDVGIRYEGAYVEKGAEQAGFTITLDYIESGALLQLGGVSGTGGPYALVGPTFALLAGSRLSGNGESVDLSDEVESSDVGFVFGGGLRLGAVSVEGRYSLGLLNVAKEESVEIKNRGVQVVLGLSGAID
jgi:hypothetical protein